jgi:hypothetical protein
VDATLPELGDNFFQSLFEPQTLVELLEVETNLLDETWLSGWDESCKIPDQTADTPAQTQMLNGDVTAQAPIFLRSLFPTKSVNVGDRIAPSSSAVPSLSRPGNKASDFVPVFSLAISEQLAAATARKSSWAASCRYPISRA